MIQKRTIGIVGTGQVGVAAAYAVFIAGLCSDLILVDKNYKKAEGEAMDLTHGQAFAGSVQVRPGGFEDLATAQLVIITAGAATVAGESRLSLLARNVDIFCKIIAQLDRHSPESVLIIASNPVDIMVYFSQMKSHRPHTRIIGTGTMLDTARFRALLGQYYEVDPRSVHAYIVGEHGDSEVPLWNSARIGGVPVVENTVMGKPYDQAAMERLFERVRSAAYEIIARKGYTSSAIGLSIARLASAILNDQKSVLPVSRRLTGEYGIEDVCLSIPSIVGIHGMQDTLLPELSMEEHERLVRSAGILKSSFTTLGTMSPA